MRDIVFVVVSIAFFVVAGLYISACDRIASQGNTPPREVPGISPRWRA